MTEIAEYVQENAISNNIDELEAQIAKAEQEGNYNRLARLVPMHYRLCIGRERIWQIKQAIDDWKMWEMGLWKYSGYTSIIAYFASEAHGDWNKAPRTRLAYANVAAFYHGELGWSPEKMALSGIGKLNQYRTFCEEHTEDGELDKNLESLMLDTEVSIHSLPGAFRGLKDGSEDSQDEEDPDKKDDVPYEWRKRIYGYDNGETTKLIAWLPYPDEKGDRQEVELEIGVLFTGDPRVAEIVAQIADGDVRIELGRE